VNSDTAHPSSPASRPAASEAGRRRRSQSASPGLEDNEYLVPRQNQDQPKYLDFPDDGPLPASGNASGLN